MNSQNKNEKSEHYYEYDRNDLSRKNPFLNEELEKIRNEGGFEWTPLSDNRRDTTNKVIANILIENLENLLGGKSKHYMCYDKTSQHEKIVIEYNNKRITQENYD